MNGEWIGPGDVRWARVLDRADHDFYHLPGYVVLTATQQKATPIAFHAELDGEAFLAPLLERAVPSELEAVADWKVCPTSDVTSPYGYPAPISTATDQPDLWRRFFHLFRRAAGERGIVSAFFRLHPLLPAESDILREFGEVVRHGQTVYIDLTERFEEFWSQTSTNHRRGIRKLQRSGFAARIDHWADYPEFCRIYLETMERVSAESCYLFDQSYFQGLRTALGDRLHLVSVLAPDGSLASGGLFPAVRRTVQYHLGGTAREHLSMAPSKLMFHFVRQWAKEEGHTLLHLGGGLGSSDDSLFRFKAGFSNRRTDFLTFRMVINPAQYHELTGRWQAKRAASWRESTDYFPAYRRPLPKAESGKLKAESSKLKAES